MGAQVGFADLPAAEEHHPRREAVSPAGAAAVGAEAGLSDASGEGTPV